MCRVWNLWKHNVQAPFKSVTDFTKPNNRRDVRDRSEKPSEGPGVWSHQTNEQRKQMISRIYDNYKQSGIPEEQDQMLRHRVTMVTALRHLGKNRATN